MGAWCAGYDGRARGHIEDVLRTLVFLCRPLKALAVN